MRKEFLMKRMLSLVSATVSVFALFLLMVGCQPASEPKPPMVAEAGLKTVTLKVAGMT
jgi:hypothetical protein